MGTSNSKNNLPITTLGSDTDSPLFGQTYSQYRRDGSINPDYNCLPTSRGANDYRNWNNKTCFGRTYPRILDHRLNESYNQTNNTDLQNNLRTNTSNLANLVQASTRFLDPCTGDNVPDWNYNRGELIPPYPIDPDGVCSPLEFKKYAIPITFQCNPKSWSNGYCIPDSLTSDGCIFGVVCAKSKWDEVNQLPCCLGFKNDINACAPTWSDKAYDYEECESALSNFCMNPDNMGNDKCNQFCAVKTIGASAKLYRRTDNPNSFCFNYARDYCTTGNNMVYDSFCKESVNVESTLTDEDDNKKRPNTQSPPQWADDFMFGIANSGGYCFANRNSTDSNIRRYCSCYTSKLLNPACTDTQCVTSGYKNSAMWSYSRNCPTICQTIIRANGNSRTNITFYDPKFINDCGGEDEFDSFYDLSGGVCVLQNGGRFRNDPTCTNENNGPSPGDIVKSPLFLPILIGGIVIVVVVIIIVVIFIFRRKNVK